MNSKLDIFVDFDGTVSPRHFPEYLDKPPHPSCISTMQKLYEDGHNIVIFSCRFNNELFGNSEEAQARIEQEVVDYLEKYNIPYHSIFRGKPHFHILLDDRGLKTHTEEEWAGVLDFVNEEAEPHTMADDPEARSALYRRFD